jgi:hypothetical protein
MGSGPARRRVGRRDELGRERSRGAKGSIVKDSQVLLDRAARSFRWKSLLALDPFLPVGVRA